MTNATATRPNLTNALAVGDYAQVYTRHGIFTGFVVAVANVDLGSHLRTSRYEPTATISIGSRGVTARLSDVTKLPHPLG